MSLGYMTALTDEQLADGILGILKTEAKARDLRQRMEQELIRRMEERRATELPHPYMEVKLWYPSPTYDPQKMHALMELVEPSTIAEAFTPQHEQTVIVAESWDMRKVRGWPKRFGDGVAAALERAKLPGGPPKLRIKERKAPDV